jgi:hypothetical protein
MAWFVLAIRAILRLSANRRRLQRSGMRLPIMRKDRLKAILLARISEGAGRPSGFKQTSINVSK